MTNIDSAGEQAPVLKPSAKRTRERRSKIRVDRQKIVDRVLGFEENDRSLRSDDIAARIQRYAKYRMWTEGSNWPWEDSSDASIPDMMTSSLRMQDTLHNAVMSHSPPVGAKAHDVKDKPKERIIDRLIEHQVFVEQTGEKIIGEVIEDFINEGVFTLFIPWIKERREVSDARLFPPIPEDQAPQDYLFRIVRSNFPSQFPVAIGKSDGWDWRVFDSNGKPIEVAFYTRDDKRVEMVAQREVVVYDGPKLIRYDYERVLYPPRSANLQMPSPSNPGGAPHVILVDYPTHDEISRLIKSGFYDLATEKDREELGNVSRDTQNQEREDQKDVLRGVEGQVERGEDRTQHARTVLVCFDTYDIDGDGVNEDVIWWVCKETKTLLKAKHLTEMFPTNPPRRPFSEGSFLPVAGRREGIGLLEIVEGLHDVQKTIIDQSIDAGTLANAPFGFYRQHGSMKPEVIRMAPGEMYPVGDPQRDVHFPTFGNRDQTFGLNMVTLLQAMEEKVTTVGDIQLGRVPPGRSSALRTIGGMALLSGQGEARPERILRRFFLALTEAWNQIHELNQYFLPEQKKFRITGVLKDGEDPYLDITSRGNIQGRFQFGFGANILNTSKEALQGALMQLGSVYINQLSIQLGIVDAEGVYRWMRDVGRAFGQDPDNYLKAPSPDSMKPKGFAEEALTMIMRGELPDMAPAEPGGYGEHLQKLVAFFQSEQFGLLVGEDGQPDQARINLFRVYAEKVQERVAQEMRQQAMLQAAGQFNQALGGENPGGRPPEQAPSAGQTPAVQSGELMDETLPGAGGGGAQAQ